MTKEEKIARYSKLNQEVVPGKITMANKAVQELAERHHAKYIDINDPFVEINESDVDTDYSDDFYDARYYIDLSSLSSEQYQLLIETIKDVEKKEYDDIHLYFEGQIEELKNF